MRMSKEMLKEQQRFLEFIKSYEYVNEDGRLDLEAFCLNLSMCFYFDGVHDRTPQPQEIFDLLIDILETKANEEEMSLWVQKQNLIDWSSEVAHVYPNGYRTYIHAAGLIYAQSIWIYNIGHSLLEIPEPDSPQKYFSWVPHTWVFVYAFINGFHIKFYEFLKGIDKSDVSKRGYSLFEALHKSKSINCSFEDASQELKDRGVAHRETIKRIERTIEAGFNLEAITLQECLISNCLFNYLESLGVKAKGFSFQKLLSNSIERCSNHVGLLGEIDSWRIKRNNAIHGFVGSTLGSFSESQAKFDLFARETALEGGVLSKRTCDWYLEMSIDFIPTEFPESDKKLN
ncbi:hypothetical protein R2R70_03815 [Cobetia sp. SIMBA_158]|uniref:hypothetical protein n=1 Tax=Cobetia sp. SIMBA_158 TaxID=3081617 RepID=UPI00397FB48D